LIGRWRLDDKVDGESIFEVVGLHGLVVLHDLARENQAELLRRRIEFFCQFLFELKIVNTN